MTDIAPAEQDFRVLMVCYANLCRSPLMEGMLSQLAAARGLGWLVSSAGVEARDGLAMHRRSRRILAQRGIDTSGWVSRRIDATRLADAHLVLTATEATRDFALHLYPGALHHTFTLLHFAHLVRNAEPFSEPNGYGPWLLEQARRMRTRLQPLTPAARDIADPMGHSMARFRKCGRIIEEALEIVLEPLPGPRWSWRRLG